MYFNFGNWAMVVLCNKENLVSIVVVLFLVLFPLYVWSGYLSAKHMRTVIRKNLIEYSPKNKASSFWGLLNCFLMLVIMLLMPLVIWGTGPGSITNMTQLVIVLLIASLPFSVSMFAGTGVIFPIKK